MKLVQSSYLEQYINNNKKEAENEFPYIIKKLIKNTVNNITSIDIPSNDNTIQIGIDGKVKFNGINQYLGDKPANIEIGTSSDYISKANEDIEKRKPKKDENFIFITPYSWRSRKISKDDWISSKKEEYNWNDIKIIDGAVLEDWLNEDIETAKYFLEKLGIPTSGIYSITEMEKQFANKTEKAIGLDFFNYEDKGYEKILTNLEKEYYHIVAPTREEGVLVTLFYLKELGMDNDVLVIDNELIWEEIVSRKLIKDAILIPNFYHYDGLACPINNTTLFIYDTEEFINKSDYVIKQRTINNLRRALERYYKLESNECDYEIVNSIIKKSLGKYIPLKRELFKEHTRPKWYDGNNIKLLLCIFFLNDFKSKDLKLMNEFGFNIDDLKHFLNKATKEKDPFVVYYKHWDEYRVINIYNAIDWLGQYIEEEDIEKLCNIANKVLLYLDPRYLSENIEKDYYVEDVNSREYSKVVRNGVLKSLIITKIYLQGENKNNLVNKLDSLIDNYYNLVNTKETYLNFASISDKLAEFNYDKFLKKIQSSIGKKEFEEMFNIKNNTFFSTNEYCNVIWGIEKAINKKDYIVEAVDVLALLSEMKNTDYKNMSNSPFSSLRTVFLGWDNLTCLDFEEKIALLKNLIDKHHELGKKLLIDIFPKSNCSWTPLLKPEFDSYDEPKTIKYIKEQVDYFNEYYSMYVDKYAKKLDDIVCIYDEIYFIDFNCFKDIKNKTLELIKNSDDEEKYRLKEKISERIRGYKKFHNAVWDLTNKQLEYLEEIRNALVYKNPTYDYIYLFQYRTFIDEEEYTNEIQQAMELIYNEENENLLLKKCDDKMSLLANIYKYKHNNKHNIGFIRKLFNSYINDVGLYMRNVYINENDDDIIDIYNNLSDLSIEDRVLILSNAGYKEKIYEVIKNTESEEIYWKTINIYKSEHSDFVYYNCLKYENYESCLEIIYDEKDKYDEKCYLLEKIKESKYKPMQLDNYKIEKIFESFYNYSKIDNFERLTKLEIYYTPILKNDTYFLSKEASNYPSVVVELANFLYKDDNGNMIAFNNENDDLNVEKTLAFNCYKKLRNLKIDFDIKGIKWCEEFIDLMKKNNRSKITFHILGQLLAKGEKDSEDDIYPSKSIREIIEYYNENLIPEEFKDLSSSFKIEKYNERGVHYIGIGEEEMLLYKQYKEWADKIKISHPATAKILKELAKIYKDESDVIRDEANYEY